MKDVIEFLKIQQIEDIGFRNTLDDKFINSLTIQNISLQNSYYEKAEELFEIDKNKAFHLYKLAYNNNHWLAPYKLGLYFQYALGDTLKSYELALNFYQEAIYRGDYRGYIQISELLETHDIKNKITLWKKFFTSDLFKDKNDFNINDIVNYNLDYRIIFLYKFAYMPQFETELKEILILIKDSILKDYDNLKLSISNLLQEDLDINEIQSFEDMLYLLDIVKNDNLEEFFLSKEDMSYKLEKILMKEKQNVPK